VVSYRTVLRIGEFRAVLGAQILSMLAVVGGDVALTVLVYQQTGSPLLSALTFAIGFVPMGVGGLLLGDVGRGRPVRDVMVACELTVAVLVAAMTIPGMPVPAMLALLAVKGCIDPVFNGTRAATLAELLGEDGFPLGRSLLRLISQNAQLVGFALGGAALTVVTPRQALMAAACAYACAALVLLVGTRRVAPTAGRGTRPRVLDGLRELFRVPGIRPLLALSLLPGFFAVAPEALAVPYAAVLQGGPFAAGLLLTGLPVGSVLGEFLSGTFLSAQRRARLVVPVAAYGFVPVLGFAAGPSLPVAVAMLVLAGLGNGYLLGLDQLMVAAVPEDVRRRCFTLLGAGTMVTQGLGFAAAGAAAEWLPVPVVVPIAAACGIAVVLAAGARLRKQPAMA
jgi:hypothetical protein